jgi:cyclopropane-fatty-acyl-phospholipid synthase
VHVFRRQLERRLNGAGVAINGRRPWDIQVHNSNLYGRVWAYGTLGAGEAYMEGWWDCERLDELSARLWRSGALIRIKPVIPLPGALKAHLINLQRGRRAFEIGRRHYDIGNELYRRMLDRHRIYSCGYWKDAEDLDAAQEAKLDLIARKLQLERGMRVLDIGCGWGGTLAYLHLRYGIGGVGITVSEEQASVARDTCCGLPIEIRLQDYRTLDERFDRILSVGMFEHVGLKNYPAYFETVRRCLEPGGLFVLHTIGTNHSTTTIDPWIAKYIFPNSMLPSASQITQAAEGLLVMEDWHSFGPDYDRTLLVWYRNLADAWDELSARYDETFYRMWTYYLLTSAGTFRARENQLWQIVFSRDGVPQSYRPEGIR